MQNKAGSLEYVKQITHYSTGFAFYKDEVILIRKTKPKWMEGLLNGVGGHVEDFDRDPVEAMVREFREETGLQTQNSQWKLFCVLSGKDYQVNFFRTQLDNIDGIEQTTEEELYLVPWNDLPPYVIDNLRWLIPMAQDDHIDGPALIFNKGHGE